MKYRIRAAGIIELENKILLVKHVHPETKFEWWVPLESYWRRSYVNK